MLKNLPLTAILSVTIATFAQTKPIDDFSSLDPKNQLLNIATIKRAKINGYDGERICVVKPGNYSDSSEELYNSINCFVFLHKYTPNITRDDVNRCGLEDLKKYYYNALKSVGLTMNEAKTAMTDIIID